MTEMMGTTAKNVLFLACFVGAALLCSAGIIWVIGRFTGPNDSRAKESFLEDSPVELVYKDSTNGVVCYRVSYGHSISCLQLRGPR